VVAAAAAVVAAADANVTRSSKPIQFL